MVSYDERPFSGRSSPWGVDLEVHRHGDEIEAILTLRAAHEGAPDRSHGGIVAGLFDDVFGFVLDVVQEAAFTGELTIRYEAPDAAAPPDRLPRPARPARGPQAAHRGRARRHHAPTASPSSPAPAACSSASTRRVFDDGTQQLPAPPDED